MARGRHTGKTKRTILKRAFHIVLKRFSPKKIIIEGRGGQDFNIPQNVIAIIHLTVGRNLEKEEIDHFTIAIFPDSQLRYVGGQTDFTEYSSRKITFYVERI